jgi:hypothetical protein
MVLHDYSAIPLSVLSSWPRQCSSMEQIATAGLKDMKGNEKDTSEDPFPSLGVISTI